MKLYTPFLAAIFLLSSCANYTQIFETKSFLPIKEENKYYVFENDTLKLTYWFWDERGIVAFNVYNKLSIPIYIDWKKSSYIKDGKKYDYWVDMTLTQSSKYYEGYSISNSASYTTDEYRSNTEFYPTPLGSMSGDFNEIKSIGATRGSTIASSFERGSTLKLERVTFIAPKSNFEKSEFHIAPPGGIILNKNRTFIKVPVKSKGKKQKYAKVFYAEYDLNKYSPVVFRNFISYSTSEKFESESYIDNGFFISRVLEMKRKFFTGKMIDFDNLIYEMPFKDPRHFYVNIPQENAIDF